MLVVGILSDKCQPYPENNKDHSQMCNASSLKLKFLSLNVEMYDEVVTLIGQKTLI